MAVINRRLYVLHGKVVWSFLIDDEFIHTARPLLLDEWLKFLPKRIENITSVYQRPNGDVVMLIDGTLYMFDIHNLSQRHGYPVNAALQYGLPQSSTIHTIINTYTGKTYLLYNEIYFAEIDEESYKAVRFGVISELFPGIPMRVDSSLRYTNGLLYFFKDNYFYEFSEFSKKIKRVGEMDYTIFGIKCYDGVIIAMFRNILSKYNVLPKRP